MNDSPPCGIECHRGAFVMEKTFDISLHEKPAGYAKVSREGLYYRFECVVVEKLSQFHRLWVMTEKDQVDLGIMLCRPEGLTLTTKIPVSRFSSEEFRFVLHNHNQLDDPKWFPIKEDAPFAKIKELKSARLLIKNGQPGAIWDSSLFD